MIDDQKYGTAWTSEELDLIVSDYFSMLEYELSKRPYVKARHCAKIMEQLGRSHRSVEFKHQNISAVLEVLGLPWINGYRPKANYQGAIFDAIDRYLSGHATSLLATSTDQVVIASPESIFVPSPAKKKFEPDLHPRLSQLIRKFDPVLRDASNRVLGKAGEAFVIDVERQRLNTLERPDLAKKIRWIADELGDGAGYDVLSFEPSGQERFIEVKTTNGGPRTPFYLSRNEYGVAMEDRPGWCIYRVHHFANQPKIFTVYPPLDDSLSLRPETWTAFF